MGLCICDVHGEYVGMNFACKHIVKNIYNKKNDKCVLVKVRLYPSTKIINKENLIENNLLEIPFCLSCYEDKMMNQRMKLEYEDDDETLGHAADKYEVELCCHLCILEYVTMNKIN